MQLRPEIQLKSMIKAMSDVILPAVDANNKLAVEQSQLVIGMLSLMAKQLPLQFRFDCDELERLIATARTAGEIRSADTGVTAALARVAAGETAAVNLLAQARIDPNTLFEAICELRAGLGEVVTTLGSTQEEANQLRIEKIILDMSKEQVLRDRALLVMQGFERDPAALPSIESLLGLDAAAA